MKAIVIGAGVVGVTTAYYLKAAGCDVTVLERLSGPADETSFGNAGQVSPGYAAPWAAPGIPWKAVKWLLHPEHAPLRIRPDGSFFQLAWMARMVANCTETAYARNKNRMVPLAEYSRDCLRQLRKDLGLHYEERSLGTLQIFRNDKQLAAGKRDAGLLDQMNVANRVLDQDSLLEVEPALKAVAHKLTGALQLPNDETGDCKLFTERLTAICLEMGVKFRFGVSVEALVANKGRIDAVELAGGESVVADAVVLAAGCASRALALPLGLDLPVYPVKGYSITVPLTNPDGAPRSTVLDETYKIALTRFDNRLRVGGMAEVAGFDKRIDPTRIETLNMVTNDLFPHAGDVRQATQWTGLRPMTPDGTPIVGATPYENLFTNTGHGTLGWTMSCGSARVIADAVLGRRAEIDSRELGMARYDKRNARIHNGNPAQGQIKWAD
ncbi:D-amino-acid dehydrogenase [Silvimonas terrae]|uniref:D-amino-acid dehydrogenase n=1 Tax=Silvimonas terrae TaxID=300266 RepID=A0A840RGG1_9NEIS|nr:D-amino acid dehydrogenase [Silvimonas terrae]MBB5192425.1 D-amino-acid dehydrogenase [Silvimonas terrae]